MISLILSTILLVDNNPEDVVYTEIGGVELNWYGCDIRGNGGNPQYIFYDFNGDVLGWRVPRQMPTMTSNGRYAIITWDGTQMHCIRFPALQMSMNTHTIDDPEVEARKTLAAGHRRGLTTRSNSGKLQRKRLF